MNYSSHDDNLIEVIELEKFNNGEVRIGPEVPIDSVEEIKIHSSFICLKCNRKVGTRKDESDNKIFSLL